LASKYDDRRKELGLSSSSNAGSNSILGDPNSKYYQRRRLLFDPVEREKAEQRKQKVYQEKLDKAADFSKPLLLGNVVPRPEPEPHVMETQEPERPSGMERVRNAVSGLLDNLSKGLSPKTAVPALQQGREYVLESMDKGAAGYADALTFGAALPVADRASRALGGSGIDPEWLEQARQSPEFKVGEVLGYLQPGAAIERGVTTLLRPVANRVRNIARGAITGATAGALETAGQEVGDVLFRGREFDPENIALGAGIGGAAGALVPGAERLIQSLRQRPLNREIENFIENIQRTETPTAHPSERIVRQLGDQTEQITPAPLRQADEAIEQATEQISAEPVRQGWFEKLFGTHPLGIVANALRGGRNTLTTEGQIVDKPIKKTARGVVGATKAAARNAYQSFVDMNAPIKKISREAYEASIDANRANQLANVIVTDKFVNPQGQVLGEGLQGIVRKAGRGNYNAFTDYLIARHALTRMQRGERVYDPKLGMTPEKVAKRVAELERRYPGFRELGQEWDQYYKNIREVYGVEEGLISRELADILEKQNPNYAPMRRQFSMEEKFKTGIGQKQMFSGQKAPIKEVSPTGSARKIVDPVRSTIEQTGAWVQAAMRNRVMRIIVDEILKDPDAMKGVAEIVQPPKGSPNLRELVEKEGAEGLLENLAEDFNKLFQRQRVDKDNIVRAMVNGQPVYVKVHDPEAVKALLGMGADNANMALRITNAFSNAIKRGATGALAPMFAVKSVTMDTMQALIQSKNPLQHAGYLMGSIISSIADALNIPVLRNMAQDFYRAGGGYSAALRGERGLRKGVESMRLDPLLSGRTIAKGIGKTIAAPYKAALKIADISENINRIAAFHHRLRQLGGARTPENIRDAMNYAREITINYSRRGRWSQGLESLIPYNNAAVQGMYRFAKAWKQNPVKTAAMVGVGVLLPKFYEYMQFHDDPDYQALPAREKYRNLIISKNPDGTFNKIPLSPEYNALGALMVDMLEAYKDGDPDAFKGAADALANAYTPPLVSGALQGVTQGGGIDQSLAGAASSTTFAPLTSVLANQSFTGAPIEPMRVQDRSPQYRYDERTSALAKWLGQQLKWSPMKIDYVIRQYGGDPARLLLPLTSEVGAGRPRETLLRNFIVDPVFTNNLQNDYYAGKELLTQAYRDNQEMGAPLPEWFDDDIRKLVTSQAKNSVTKRLSALQEEKRQVSVDKSLSVEERAEKLRDIQRQMNEIYIDVNTKMAEAGVPLPRR